VTIASTALKKGKEKALEAHYPPSEQLVDEIVSKMVDLDSKHIYEIVEVANQRLGPLVFSDAKPNLNSPKPKKEDPMVLQNQIKNLREELEELKKKASLFKTSYEKAKTQKEKAEKEVFFILPSLGSL